MAYEIEELLASPETYTAGNNGRTWIVVHYTATQASAHNNCIYFSGGNRSASAHYFIDDSSIWRSVPENDTAWHAGNWLINTTSIGIEVVSDGRDFSEGEINRLAWLVRTLMDRYGIDAQHVIRHYDVADVGGWDNTLDPHKLCPRPYINQDKWNALHARITGGEDDVTPEELWKTPIDGVRPIDMLRGGDAAANYVKNIYDNGDMARNIGHETIWGHHTVDGNNQWSLGGAVNGTDKAANASKIMLEQYLPVILGTLDQNGVAKEVQEAVRKQLEKIQLNVNVAD